MHSDTADIRPLSAVDLPEIVRVHQSAFPGFFLTDMGPQFLRAYYSVALSYDKTIALGSFNHSSGALTGFVLGFSDPTGFYRMLRKSWPRWSLWVLMGVAKKPSLLRNVLMNSKRVSNLAHDATSAVELASLAVDGQGRGVGSALVSAFIAAPQARAVGRVFLTTDAHGNADVRRFYERRGFTAVGTEFRGSRELVVYQLILS